MQTIEAKEQQNAASIEMERAVGKLLSESFEIIEQEQQDQDVEDGCLSCS